MQVGSSNLVDGLFATDTLSKIGQLGKTDSAKPSAAAEAARKAELAKSSQRAVLDEIREKGNYAWAQEQKLEKLKEKIEAEVRSANPDADPATWVAPADLAAVILFLASPESRAMTGALIPVTGRV